MKLIEFVDPELQLLLENKAQFVAQQKGDALVARYKEDTKKTATALQIAEMLQQIDKKYLVWLADIYLKKQYKMEDASRLKETIAEFNRVKSKLKQKDINQYKIGRAHV